MLHDIKSLILIFMAVVMIAIGGVLTKLEKEEFALVSFLLAIVLVSLGGIFIK